MVKVSLEQAARMATLQLEANESVHVLHPNQIIAFQGKSEQREDSLMKLPGMYRKKRFIQSRLYGPLQFMMGVPEGYSMAVVPIGIDDDLLYEFRHVLFYTEGITFTSHLQSVKNTLITQDLVKMQFRGPGTLGLLTTGPLYQMELHSDNPLYVDTNCLIAYPKQASLRLCVYGNTMASQHMNYHWEMTGQGKVLLQPCKPDRKLDEHMQGDSLFKRIIREVVPFGGIFIK
ncbi:AIM24 family protein [Paenibacillus sp. SYP-B3998]|uniref:AIM24 family protein n=1 Tax=Paenibacillus sp. SYP-B3998 TaxID=2678564 RepID=A0A6G4A606_9BACL|nr:AIM24 family protein [Paenibacillus sp. SYP-B3998]NEW09239.1 AIM24 family protein [Paenibacillus sp. SYP-B3998]